MKVTLTAIKADIGSIGGHICPSRALVQEVECRVQSAIGRTIIDCAITYTGDDVAVLMTHDQGVDATPVHRLARDALISGQRWPSTKGCTVRDRSSGRCVLRQHARPRAGGGRDGVRGTTQ